MKEDSEETRRSRWVSVAAAADWVSAGFAVPNQKADSVEA
jgi:hypothetical protein